MQLINSELFGHAKGSFTGANASRNGRLYEADGGTLLIDEGKPAPAVEPSLILRGLEHLWIEFDRR